eukprot:TRINITY_DN3524_c0_g1_i2.p1 TRINITY_DN3524_c0_g1~~TRINITY_DN3524_c0_g1_i2.p1  ORF type:complete len:295 (-),score=54.84 TRINITY_DN3524_c0_g1_i2:32-916(-)
MTEGEDQAKNDLALWMASNPHQRTICVDAKGFESKLKKPSGTIEWPSNVIYIPLSITVSAPAHESGSEVVVSSQESETEDSTEESSASEEELVVDEIQAEANGRRERKGVSCDVTRMLVEIGLQKKKLQDELSSVGLSQEELNLKVEEQLKVYLKENDIDYQWLRDNFVLQEEKEEYKDSVFSVVSFIGESLFQTDLQLIEECLESLESPPSVFQNEHALRSIVGTIGDIVQTRQLYCISCDPSTGYHLSLDQVNLCLGDVYQTQTKLSEFALKFCHEDTVSSYSIVSIFSFSR